MLYGIFEPRRPKPIFRVGQLVVMKAPWSSLNHYMVIEKRQWGRSGAATKKCWLYDGPILRVERERLIRSTCGYQIPESDLEAIPGTD